MSELTKLIVIISRNLSKALENIASDLEHSLSQAQNPDLASLTTSKNDFVHLDVGVFVLFVHKSGNRYGGIIRKIDGDNLEVNNDVLGKIWTISKLQVFYSRPDTND